MMTTQLNSTEVIPGAELTFRFESQIEEWPDQDKMTVTVQRINGEGKMYLEREDGTEFGYIVAAERYDADEDAQMRKKSGRPLGLLFDVRVVGEDDDEESKDGSEVATDGGEGVGDEESGNVYGYDARLRVTNAAECMNCGAVDESEQGIRVGLVSELNESVCNVCRAEQLQEETVLKRREAEVYALREQGYDDKEIAKTLQNLHNADSPQAGTISTHRSNIRKKLERARNTLNEIGENRL